MTRLRHDPLTQALHWLIALAVVATYGLGLIREDLPKGDFRNWIFVLHTSIGMLVFGASVVRIAWRTLAPAPAPIEMSPAFHLAAKAGHLLLYAALLAVPALGFAAIWVLGYGVHFFNLATLPSPFTADRALGHTLEEIHGFAAHAMLLLAGAHAVIAIAHQYLLKDGTLGRMLPFVSPQPSSAPR